LRQYPVWISENWSIWIGGAGAIGISGLPAGVKVLANLDDLHYELSQLAAG